MRSSIRVVIWGIWQESKPNAPLVRLNCGRWELDRHKGARSIISMADYSGFEEFCREHQSRLIGILSLYCGDRDIAEELAQETLIRTYAAWGRVSKLAHPASWTYRVAMNLANSLFRRRLAERNVNRKHVASGVESYEMTDIIGELAIRTAVARLPRQQRAVLILRYYADLSVRDTADLLQIPDGTVKTLSRKAIQRLRNDSGLLDSEVVINVG